MTFAEWWHPNKAFSTSVKSVAQDAWYAGALAGAEAQREQDAKVTNDAIYAVPLARPYTRDVS